MTGYPRIQEKPDAHGVIGCVMHTARAATFAQSRFGDVAFGPTNLKPLKEDIKSAEETLELVGLSHKAQVSPFELWGQQRLGALAGVLAMRPRILILDEPTAGLDLAAERICNPF